jgi:hypothetical protein
MRWAEIIDGIVNRITVSEDETFGADWLSEVFGTQWVYVADDVSVGPGYSYNEERDAFLEEQPFDSWILDEETYTWVAPIPIPDDGFDYYWNESQGDWVELIDEAV